MENFIDAREPFEQQTINNFSESLVKKLDFMK